MDAFSDPQYKTADGAALRIWRDAAPNKFLTEQNGRGIFDEVIFVEVITPGSKDSTPVFELERTFCELANRPEPRRGPKYAEYAQYVEDFKRSEDNDSTLAGTPLSQWPEMNRSMVAALKAQNIFTVEALAALPDTKLVIVGPDGRTWRSKAVAYIETAKNSGFATELAAKVETLIADLDAGKQRETALAARIAELEAAGTGSVAAPPTPKAKAAKTPAPVTTTAAAAAAAADAAEEVEEVEPEPEVDPITGEKLVPAALII